MKRIYPTKAACWSMNGQGVDVKAGEPVDHPRDDIAKYLVDSGAATYDPPKAKASKQAPEVKQVQPPENKGA